MKIRLFMLSVETAGQKPPEDPNKAEEVCPEARNQLAGWLVALLKGFFGEG